MIKKLIKSLLGKNNVNRIRRIKHTFRTAVTAYKNYRPSEITKTKKEEIILSSLVSVHRLEKTMAVQNERLLNARYYSAMIKDIYLMLENGADLSSFAVRESTSVISSVLASISGHEEEKAALKALIAEHNISLDCSGGVQKLKRSEIFAHNDFDFHGFVSSRHSVRKFKDKIISRDVIRSIVRDANCCPSACNRQPCKVYFSEDKDTVTRIIKSGADSLAVKGLHDRKTRRKPLALAVGIS